MKQRFVIFWATIMIILGGCTEDHRIDNLQQEIVSLKKEITELKQQMELEQMFKNFEKYAYLTPGNESYSIIRFDLGALTISIDNVVDYANGSKVTLLFGNPLSATINGLTALIEYGETDENGTPQNDKAKTKEITFNESLRPGSWTKLNIVLPGISSSKLGFVRVRNLLHTGIRLNR